MLMQSRGEVVNFRTVAQVAGVSKDFLYSQPDIRLKIEQQRSSKGTSLNVPPREKLSSAGAAVQLQVVKEANSKLREEVGNLRQENAVLRGELLSLRRRLVSIKGRHDG
jgi:hypothetical protein